MATNGTNGVNGHHEEESVLLPSAKSYTVSANVTIQPPLSRRGHGPPLILLVPEGLDLSSHEKTLDPPPLQKWAEEGYAVAQITIGVGLDVKTGLDNALKALNELPECDSDQKAGMISYDVEISEDDCKYIEPQSAPEIAAVIVHGDKPLSILIPQQVHTPGASIHGKLQYAQVSFFDYPNTTPHFTIPSHPDFRSAPASVLHTRCLAFLKPLMGGPSFDLEAIWEEHCKFEFADRAVDKTMGTMVQEPYVNHIPTLTGGIGRKRLSKFYQEHFVFVNPADTNLELVSRTVGVDRVIDEFVTSFTHDRVVDWILPGVPPTYKHIQVPCTSVVNVRGDRLYHEHIGWDQATVLRQLGLLPEYLPFPYDLPDGKKPEKGKRFEYKVPTAGVETARKLVDERSVESNLLFEGKVREVDA